MKRLATFIISAALSLAASAASMPVKLYVRATGAEYTAITCTYDSSSKSLNLTSSAMLGDLFFYFVNADTGEKKNANVYASGDLNLIESFSSDNGNVDIKVVTAEGEELCYGQVDLSPVATYTYDSAGNRVKQKK